MFDFEGKICSIDDVCTHLASVREGKRIVAMSGSFDVVHAGHAMVLEEAKSQGDILVVFLNTDASIALYKGPARPAIPFRDRAAVIASMRAVDYVVPLEDLTPIALIERLKPDVYFNGADWGDRSVERSTVLSYGGTLTIASAHTRISSSSDVIRRIQDSVKIPVHRGVFLDRDGVLIVDREYVHVPAEVELLPHAVEGLKKLCDAGWDPYVVTNQSGIGRGMYTVADMEAVHARIRELLAPAGVVVKAFYHCPHRPEDGCDCRKPGVGMLVRAAREHSIALTKSWMIGDKSTDIEAGRLANMHTIAISKEAPAWADSPSIPDAWVPDLEGAADRILADEKSA